MAIKRVEFKLAKDLPESVRVHNNFGENDFVEIRVENTVPSIHVEKVKSPAKRVNDILKKEGVKIRL